MVVVGRIPLAPYLGDGERIRAALAAVWMLVQPRRWIHRRVETIQFLDEARVLRRTSVDFTVPNLAAYLPTKLATDQELVLVPLALLKKEVLRNFDLRDEQVAALPTLTGAQNVALSATMLENLAELTIAEAAGAEARQGTRLRNGVYNDLVAIASGDLDAAVVALTRLREANGDDSADNDQRRIVWQRPELRTLAEDLAGQFVLFVPLPAQRGDRRVIKFSYEELLAPLKLTPRQRLGLAAVTLGVPAPSLGNGASYHAELPCPPELVITGADLHDVRPRELTGPVVAVPAPAEPVRLTRELGLRQRAHLHTTAANRDAIGSIAISFRVPPAGLLWAAVAIAWITAAIPITGLILYAFGVGARGDTAAALLAAVPGIFATYLARPGEHPLVQRLASGIRALIGLLAALSFAAAATLAVDVGRGTRFWLWVVLLIVTVLIAVTLSASLLGIHAIAVRGGRLASPAVLRAEPRGAKVLSVANGEEADVAGPARTLIRWLLTVGAAALYGVLVLKVGLDVWVGNDPVTVDKVLGGVMNSIALTFGSAFVGWFGVTTSKATVSLREAAVHRRVEIFRQLMTNVAGAAVFAMVIYLAIGAFAGITYVFNEGETPTVLITVATAWAAQASAVVAATLAAVLKPQ